MMDQEIHLPEKPEDHPEQHPWETRYITGDADDVIHGLWCPHCGAIAYRAYGVVYGVRFPAATKLEEA